MMNDYFLFREDLRRLENNVAFAKHAAVPLVLTDNWRQAEPMTVYAGADRVGETIRVRLPRRYQP